MKKEIEKTESVKTKKYTVLDGKTEVLNTSKLTEVTSNIEILKKELKPLIVLLDNEEKISLHYTKTIHQNNYRVQAGNYEKDSVLKPAPEVTQTEE